MWDLFYEPLRFYWYVFCISEHWPSYWNIWSKDYLYGHSLSNCFKSPEYILRRQQVIVRTYLSVHRMLLSHQQFSCDLKCAIDMHSLLQRLKNEIKCKIDGVNVFYVYFVFDNENTVSLEGSCHIHALYAVIVQYIPRNMHTVLALLCFVVVIHWLIFPYPSGLLHWHCGNLTIAPVPAKQPWWIWINTSCEFIMNDCITTTKQSTTKPCAYFLGYTVRYSYASMTYPRKDEYIRQWTES